MASTFTPNGRLALQDNNDNPNTWGKVLNQQVISLIDEMCLGAIDINITGSSNVTLSTENGLSDQARHRTLILTGALGANIELILPSVENNFAIVCSWSGDYTVTAKISGSSTEVVLNTGDVVEVVTDGTDTYKIGVNPDLFMKKANNLDDVADVATARDNLELGELATLDIGAGLSEESGALVADPSYLVGEMKMWPTETAPAAFLNCDGSAVSRTTYADLYAVIGVLYGSGDGSTTFNLPDFRGRSPIGIGQGLTAEGDATGTDRDIGDIGGYETHTLIEDEMPEHDHTLVGSGGSSGPQVALSKDSNSGTLGGLVNPAGGDLPHNNMHPFAAINFIIYTGVTA